MWRFLLIFPALSACADFPALDATLPPRVEATDYLDLVPLQDILAEAQARPEANAQTEADVASRVAALRARANRLRGEVVDEETQARMATGVRTSGEL